MLRRFHRYKEQSVLSEFQKWESKKKKLAREALSEVVAVKEKNCRTV